MARRALRQLGDKAAPAEVEDTKRKARGAFFTSPEIAAFLARWAVHGDASARVLDPTCGEAAFLLAAGQELRRLGCDPGQLDDHLFGVDLHEPSLDASMKLLETEGLDAHLVASDFFALGTPDQLHPSLPWMDAVVGNPPFVRYQMHSGRARQRSAAAALRQGVRLSGLASSWAAVLVNAAAFLKPTGRLAMVLPAELLTVHYAEPIRRWLRTRFGGVTLVMFERLQFEDALEKVVLVLAHGSGGCDSFSLVYADDADDLDDLRFGDGIGVTPASEGKWTDLLLTLPQRQLFRRVSEEHFCALSDYGTPELGAVTGANDFFALSESTRVAYRLREDQLRPICPPGTRHLRGTTFTKKDWRTLKDADERVWLLHPDPTDKSAALRRYVAHGEDLGVPDAYKCQIRTPWWRAPVVPIPDLYFTYMSHRYPRLINNTARVSFLNSMHGVRLRTVNAAKLRSALPLLMFNSVTMLGAEVFGRSYGGGILKMEPREAGRLPLPREVTLLKAWESLKPERDQLEHQLREGRWTNVAKRVDTVLLQGCLGLTGDEVAELHEGGALLRERRLSQ